MSRIAPWPTDPLPALAERAARRPAVVLDDDPTGTQTVRDVFVLTSWDPALIGRHLDDPAVFLSTNSRSLDEVAAVRVTEDAAHAAVLAAAETDRPMSIISRSDSTLRGHFPAEAAAAVRALGSTDARLLLAPYFGEGGRFTVDDVHHLERYGVRTPVAETEFARDPVFGYRSSNLRDWVAEKYAASGLAAPPTTSIPIELVRTDGPSGVAEALRALAAGGVAIANAETDRDIEVVALGVLMAEEDGLTVVGRTAASYVRARAGMPRAPVLSAAELAVSGPGLVVVGSHVRTTTDQIDRLFSALSDEAVRGTELRIADLVAERSRREAAVGGAVGEVQAALRHGRTAVVSTERTRREIGLDGGRLVSSALVEVVRRLDEPPAWVIAKGGITSSDVASRGLEMREARVAGQILPGVPVWISTDAGRWPGLPLVVFPGNVGAPTSLLDAVQLLSGR